MRFGVFNLVLISAMAGLGAAWLLAKVPQSWRYATTTVLILLVLVDFFPRPFNQLAEVTPRPVDYWLADQPGKGAVVQMPFTMSEDQDQTFFTLTYDKPFIGGFFNAFPPHQYQEVKPVLNRFPDKTSVDLLKSLGAEYIIVDTKSYADPVGVKTECEALGLVYQNEMGGQMVFVMRQ